MAKGPDRLNIDKTDRKIYDQLQDEGLFKSLSNREQFIFALSIGFKNDAATPLKTKDGFFFANDLQPKERVILNAIALSVNNNPEILTETDKIYEYAEQYAHGGILIIYQEINSMQYGSYEKGLEKALFEISEKYSLENA